MTNGLLKKMRSLSGTAGVDRINNKFLPLAPAVGYILMFLFLPMAYLGLLSFYQYDPVNIFVREFTLENYATLIADPFYRQFLIYTVKVAFITTIICFVTGYPIGYYLARLSSSTKRQVMLFLILLPLMVGIVVRTYGWMLILGTNGFINRFLAVFSDVQLDILGTTTAVILGLIGVLLPFMILPIYSSIQDVDSSLELASRNLGANKFTTFYKIVFPLSIPGIVTGSIFCFTLSMSAIVTPRVLGGRTDFTIGSLIYDLVLTDTNWPLASAMAITVTIVNLLLVFLYLRTSAGQREGLQ